MEMNAHRFDTSRKFGRFVVTYRQDVFDPESPYSWERKHYSRVNFYDSNNSGFAGLGQFTGGCYEAHDVLSAEGHALALNGDIAAWIVPAPLIAEICEWIREQNPLPSPWQF